MDLTKNAPQRDNVIMAWRRNHNPATCIKMVQENGEEAAKVNRYV